MGAPKQRWTAEEEAALRAGVVKYGPGKWRTILRDPQFTSVLRMRSNVDLKDKWRNLCVTAGGWGSREKARIALRKGVRGRKKKNSSICIDPMVTNGSEVIDAKPNPVASLPISANEYEKEIARPDELIIEAIQKSNAPSGCSKASIAAYIESQFWPPPIYRRALSATLKSLVASGILLKIDQKYRLASSSSSKLHREERQVMKFTSEESDCENIQIDPDVSSPPPPDISSEEAADRAAKAIAAAELAIAEAEEASRLAEAAEAEAEEAKVFAEAVVMAMAGRNGAAAPAIRAH